MKKNMGSTDRVIRLILAAVFVALYFTGNVTGMIGYGLLALSAIFIVTSLISFCPIYVVAGMSTCSTSGQKS